MSTMTHDELLQQARGLMRQRDYAGAAAIYRQILSADADSVPAHEGLAMVSFATGDYPTAIDAFHRLAQLEPLEARHYVNLGAVHNRAGEHQKAAECLRKAIQRDRRCADAYYNLGIAQRKLGQLSMAVSAYKEAIRLDPQMVESYQNLGNIYVEMGNHQLAITNFQKALELRPDFAKARLGLERAEDALKQAKAATSPFGRLVKEGPSGAGQSVSEVRTLTPQERIVDREVIRRTADELKTLATECEEFLHHQFEPALLALQRSVAEGDLTGIAFARAGRDFNDRFAEWIQLRSRFREKMLELRAHEELVTMPGALLKHPQANPNA